MSAMNTRTRKQHGPRSVVCSSCGKRGVANKKLLDQNGKVTCAECKRSGNKNHEPT